MFRLHEGYLKRWSWSNIKWMAALGAAAGWVIASFYVPGGDDLYRYYLPFAQGCLSCGFVPYFSQWLLAPLRLLPGYPLTWPLWTVIHIAIFLLLAYVTEVNPFFLLISFPMLGQVWLGQIDVLIATGLVLFIKGQNPYLRGLGLILALTKPQLTAIPLILCLLLESPRLWMRLLTFPILIFLVSLLAFGFGWPVQWFSHAVKGLPVHVWRLASLDIWRFGLLLFPLPLFLQEVPERMQAGLLVAALATPFYGVYSYVLFLLFNVNLTSVLFSYAWLLGWGIWGAEAMRLAWILPFASLVDLFYREWKLRH